MCSDVGAYRIRPRKAAYAKCRYGVVYLIGRMQYAPTKKRIFRGLY